MVNSKIEPDEEPKTERKVRRGDSQYTMDTGNIGAAISDLNKVIALYKQDESIETEYYETWRERLVAKDSVTPPVP